MPSSPTGNAIRSAGNTFSHLYSDFRNLSSANPVVYWHTQGEDVPTVNLLNTYANPNAVNANTCPDNFTDGDVMLVLSPTEMNDLTTDYAGHRNEVNNFLQQLTTSIDDGDTQAMINKINNWGGTSKELTTDLLSTSPYFSRGALEAVVDRSGLLTDEQRHDVLAANPVELRNATLFDYIANSAAPLSSSYLNSLELASELFLSRSEIEGEISARKATMNYLAGKALKSTLTDTLSTDYADIRTWLQRKGKIESELAIAETYIAEGSLDIAAAYIANIGSIWNFGASDLEKYNQFNAIKTLQMQLITAGRSWAELDSTEIVELTNIAEAEAGFPTAQAQGILDFFYDYSYDIPVDLTGATQNSEQGNVDLSKNKESSITTYPNPANDWITFRFDEPLSSNTELSLSNLKGNVIASYKLEAGQQEHRINTSDYPVGTYFYQLIINGENEIGKVVLIK